MNTSDPVTLIISEVVKPEYLKDFETWSKDINQAVQNVKGFISVETISPKDKSQQEYVTIVRFDHYDNLGEWRKSPTCKKLIEQSNNLFEERSLEERENGPITLIISELVKQGKIEVEEFASGINIWE